MLESIFKKAAVVSALVFGLGKPLEAQTNLSFYYGGSSPVRDMSISVYNSNLNFPLDFNSLTLVGARLERNLFYGFGIGAETYLTHASGEGIRYASFHDSTDEECEFGEDTFLLPQCFNLNESTPAFLSLSASVFGSLTINPFSKSDRLSIYAGAGPIIRHTGFVLLREAAKSNDFGFGFFGGIRWRIKEEEEYEEIFLEYGYDGLSPRFLGQSIREKIYPSDPSVSPHKLLLGFRMKL